MLGASCRAFVVRAAIVVVIVLNMLVSSMGVYMLLAIVPMIMWRGMGVLVTHGVSRDGPLQRHELCCLVGNGGVNRLL